MKARNSSAAPLRTGPAKCWSKPELVRIEPGSPRFELISALFAGRLARPER